MIVLTILNADGNVMWVQHFNDMESCDKWIAEEQTRSYWNPSNTYTVQDNRPTPEQLAQLEQQMIADKEAREQLKQSAKAKLKALGLTDEEVLAILGG